jgi:hypothetical protein
LTHTAHADRVGMAAEHQRAARRPAVEHANDVGSARRSVSDLDVEPYGLELARNPPRARGDSEGFTESIDTRSHSNAIAGSASTVIRGIIDA